MSTNGVGIIKPRNVVEHLLVNDMGGHGQALEVLEGSLKKQRSMNKFHLSSLVASVHSRLNSLYSVSLLSKEVICALLTSKKC